MEQANRVRLRTITRALALLVLLLGFLMIVPPVQAATQEPSVAEDSSMMTSLKKVAILTATPVTMGLMFFGSKRFKGEPRKQRQRTSVPSTRALPTRSRPSAAPPPSRDHSRSAMRQVSRLKRK